MSRRWTPETAARVVPWIIVVGYVASRVFSDWIAGVAGVAGYVLLLWTFHRRNQRKEREMPPNWTPGKPPNPN